jgi:hypothetical protein
MGITREQATSAVGTMTPVYDTMGRSVVLYAVETDAHSIDYALWAESDPDDGEPLYVSADLTELHLRPQVSANVPVNPCNCEHTNHFDDEYGPRPDGAHVFMDVSAGSYEARYVGAVCDACAQTCMADYLI